MEAVPAIAGEPLEDVKHKVARLMEMRHENESDTVEALRALSSFCTVSSALRRNLDDHIERRNLQIYEGFVACFRLLKEKLDSLYEDIFKLNEGIEKMAASLWDSRHRTHHLISQTAALQEEKRKLDIHLDLVNAFIKHFQLTPAENTVLHGIARDSPITADFFNVLSRIDNLHGDCKTLIHSGFETAALDIMEKISLHREAAIERLYRWAQHQCRNFDGDTDSLLPTAMDTLQSRPVLFKYVVDEYCTARKSNLVRTFIDALTKDVAGAGKPIEYYAHQPKRYIGDMLAWIHQAIPIEKEGLNSLFRKCTKIDLNEELRSALTEITEGLCHPLKVRLDLILTNDKDAILLCSIINLIRYYGKILNEEINSGALCMTLNELLQQSEAVFLASVEGKVSADLARGVTAPPSDLSPSPIVTQLLGFLREIISTAPVAEQRERADLMRAVTLVVDPLLRAINLTACHLSSTDMAVYLLNCIYQIQCTVSLCNFTNDYNERLQAQSDAQMDTLTSEQASSLVANLNLGPIYTILEEQDKAPLSAVPGMESGMLKSFMNKFDSFIAMPDVFLLPQITLLISSANRTTVRKRSFQVIIAIYKNLHSAVHDPVNKYENPQLTVRRTPDEVLELLSLQ